MRLVNRTAVVLHPRAPFIDWVVGTLEPDLALSRESVAEPANSYLLPPIEDPADKERFLRQYFKRMFEAELEAWVTNPREWPTRDLTTFRAWFHATFHELVFDLAPDSLLAEEEP